MLILIFLSSFAFLPHSLDKLISDLKTSKSKKEFTILRRSKLFLSGKKFSEEKFELALKKGHCPFDYMNSKQYLLQTSLPPRSHFYSKMNLQELSQENYQHCESFWLNFGCDSLLDYLITYCRIGK